MYTLPPKSSPQNLNTWLVITLILSREKFSLEFISSRSKAVCPGVCSLYAVTSILRTKVATIHFILHKLGTALGVPVSYLCVPLLDTVWVPWYMTTFG